VLFLSSGVLTLNPDDVQSAVPVPLIINGSKSYFDITTSDQLRQNTIKAFDYANLQDPVPASVYYDARPDCWGEQTHCATITDGTYRPNLVLRNRIWLDLVRNASIKICSWPVLADPHMALYPLDTTLDSPVLPLVRTQSPLPGSTAYAPVPDPTVTGATNENGDPGSNPQNNNHGEYSIQQRPWRPKQTGSGGIQIDTKTKSPKMPGSSKEDHNANSGCKKRNGKGGCSNAGRNRLDGEGGDLTDFDRASLGKSRMDPGGSG
jgi:hypothetical protein